MLLPALTPDELAAGEALFNRPWQFLKSVPDLQFLPTADRHEVALAGRSNVGKSSLINALVKQRGLARTSNTPGRTQELNYFEVPGTALFLVDMPGYGFAKAPKAKVDAWTSLVKDYLRGRPNLLRVFLLIDARHGIIMAGTPSRPLENVQIASIATLHRRAIHAETMDLPPADLLWIDEAHHCLPAKWDPAPITLPQELPAAIAVTVHPEAVAPDFLKLVSTVIGVGDGSRAAIEAFCTATGRSSPTAAGESQPGEAHILTPVGTVDAITPVKPKEKQKRHARKYAEGDLGEDRSFYFRGPDGALKLRAQNLSTFLQMAEGVDDKTWLHHLRAGEYSKWFREAIKDEDLASDASAVEVDLGLSATESRRRLKTIVERRYTAPASKD
jgi:GTP-binding protein EngB required for normal cell division